MDDVGAEQTSPWVLEQLYTIVNTRYEDGRAMVLTTNLRRDALCDQVGGRTVSRLFEMWGDPIPMFGHDRRVELDPRRDDDPEDDPPGLRPRPYGFVA